MSEASDTVRRTAFQLFAGDSAAPATTRHRLIVEAFNLVHEIGFHALGLDRLLAQVGVTKTTFYNHFESKDDLLVEVIRLRDDIERKAFSDRTRELAEGQGISPLLAMFDVLDEWFNDPSYRGCIFIHACAEFPSAHDPVHIAAARHYAVSAEMLRELALAEGYEDADGLAEELLILIEGAFTYRLVTGNNAAARTARVAAERALREREKRC